jgi:predicted metalloprotease
MRWQGRKASSNVEDRRGGGIGRGVGIGGVGSLVIALIAMYFGQDPGVVLDQLQGGGQAPSNQPYQETAQEGQRREFVSVVLADTETTWTQLFQGMNQSYQEPTLVLFSNVVESACGRAGAAVGPFYCPGDRKVYIDLSFYDELQQRFGAPGDFAQAYVIAHEVGHHVQTLLGISEQMRAAQQRGNEAQANELSVRLELQADCFAGIWAHNADSARQLLEAGDIDEGLNAASAIGDDRLQREAGGRVVPESFTHGSSEQRVRWFKRGFETGDMQQCDTFAARTL